MKYEFTREDLALLEYALYDLATGFTNLTREETAEVNDLMAKIRGYMKPRKNL